MDTPWRIILQLEEGKYPEWRALYKSPLTKKCRDLQLRILHGVVAVNAFISAFNPDVGHDCPFCLQRETVFHTFMQCSRIEPLFTVVQNLFLCFGETGFY